MRHILIGAALLSLATADLAQAAEPACRGSDGYAAAFQGRRTFLWRPDHLTAIKARLTTNPDDPAYVALLARADAALTHAPYTVVDKTGKPASGDPHDYMSIGPYWWPDPSKPDGLPYIRRDGHVNPERVSQAFDTADFEAMSKDVQALSLAYYFTSDERYARKAAQLVRVWFLDPATRMNPNLNHGQAIPGVTAGRASGIIDLNRLFPVVESLGLLDTSDTLTDQERHDLRQWFGDMVDWLINSPIGRKEAAATNNHGIFYDAMVTQFALYSRKDDVAASFVDSGRERLAHQIAIDGSLPEELTRTRSFHYSTWTVTGAFNLADLSMCVGRNLWAWHSANGRSLRLATDYLAAYAGRERDWPYPELSPDTEVGSFYELLERGAWAWSDAELAQKALLYRESRARDDLNLILPLYTAPDIHP